MYTSTGQMTSTTLAHFAEDIRAGRIYPGKKAKHMISPTATIVVSKDQVSCDLAGEAAILNLKNSVYYGLDPVGARIWNLIQTPTTVGAVRDAIVQEYDVDAERCERDLLDLLDKLASEGLIDLKDETAA